jgi:hypothetical protein
MQGAFMVRMNPRFSKTLGLLTFSLALIVAHAADTPEVESLPLEQIELGLDKIKQSIKDAKTQAEKITAEMKNSRGYLNTLASSPANLIGKDLKEAGKASQDLSYEEWEKTLSGNKDAVKENLLKDSAIQNSMATLESQMKTIGEELKQLQAQGSDITEQFNALSTQSQKVKKTMGNMVKIPGLLLKVKSTAGELKGFDTILTSAFNTSSTLGKQASTLYSVIPEAIPPQTAVDRAAAAEETAPNSQSARAAARSATPARSAPHAQLQPTAAPAPAPDGRRQPKPTIAGLWSGEIEHLSSGGKVRINMIFGAPRTGQIIGYIVMPVRDEQAPLFLMESSTERYLFATGVDASATKRRIKLGIKELLQNKLVLEIVSEDGVSELSGELARL